MTWPSFNQTDNIDLSLVVFYLTRTMTIPSSNHIDKFDLSLVVLLPDQNIDLTKL